MSNINLNPARQVALAATHPLVPKAPTSTGMSATAKIISTLALLFFAAFVYVATNRRSSPRDDSDKKSRPGFSPRPNDQQQQIATDITLLRTAMQEYQAENGADTGKMFSLMDSETPMNAATKETLIEFVAQLRYDHPRIVISEHARRLTDPKEREIRAAERAKIEATYEKALEADRAKRVQEERQQQMEQALNTLKADLEEATRSLNERAKILLPAALCCARYKRAKGKAEEIEKFQIHFGVTAEVLEALNREAPTDQFADKVEKFEADFSEETFTAQKADLQEAYASYKAHIEHLKRQMAWKEVCTEARLQPLLPLENNEGKDR